MEARPCNDVQQGSPGGSREFLGDLFITAECILDLLFLLFDSGRGGSRTFSSWGSQS